MPDLLGLLPVRRKRKPINPRRALTVAIRRHAQAQIALSWIGSAPPSDHAGIQQEADAAALRVVELLSLYVPEEA